MDRVCILIDGSNFYHLVLKKFGLKETQFDFEKFAGFLANGREISDTGKRFYTGTVSERKVILGLKKQWQNKHLFLLC